jgi:hypothetical protein
MTLTSARRLLGIVVLFTSVSGPAATASAQEPAADPLSRAKALYASASYEEALSLLNGLALADQEAIEAAQYRAFCLIALGRTEDATRAIESVVADDPMFMPSAADLSPRVIALFSETRRKLLPDVLRRLFKEGRDAYDAKAHDQALQKFAALLAIAADPEMREVEGVADLQVLANGFADLSRAARAAAATAAAAAAPPRPTAAAPPARPAAPPLPAVAIRQEFPRWAPTNVNDRSAQFEGIVRVIIGIDGAVLSAEIVEPIHPAYDELLLDAARQWTYRPATREGRAVESTKDISVRLFPPQ